MLNAFYSPEHGFADRSRLNDYRLDRLKAQLSRVYEKSEFHRKRFDDAGVHPGMIRSFGDLARVPFMDKSVERESQRLSQERGLHALGMHIVCDPGDVVRISATSGTTGTPTFTGYTRKDNAVSAEIMKRFMGVMGARKGDPVMHAFVMSMWIAGLPVADAMQDAGLTVVPIGGKSGPESFAVTAAKVRPRQLNCTPSYAIWMGEALRDGHGTDPADFGIERILLAGEPGGSIGEVRSRISALWGGARIYDVIGAIHTSFVASISCDHNAGLHFLAEDVAHLELIDPASGESLPMEDGVCGEGVYTALEKECAPAIRFRTGDRFMIRRGPCACGRDTIRFFIQGRTDDMLLVRGVNVFPSALFAVIQRFTDRGITGNARIVLTSPPPVQEPPLPVRVALSGPMEPPDRNRLIKDLQNTISGELRFQCRIELVDAGAFAAFQENKNQKKQIFDREYQHE